VHAVCGSTVNNKLIASGGADRRLILFDVNQHKLLKECRTTSVIVDMVSGLTRGDLYRLYIMEYIHTSIDTVQACTQAAQGVPHYLRHRRHGR
jgi:methyl coenzyme M reductase subunit C